MTILHLTGRDILAADLEHVLVTLDVDDHATLDRPDDVAGLEPPVVKAVCGRLGVAEVLEKDLDTPRAPDPQFAGPAVETELAGLLVDDGDLIARVPPARWNREARSSVGFPVTAWVTVSVMP